MRFANWPFLLLLFLIPLFHRFWMKRNQPARVVYSLPVSNQAARRSLILWVLGLKYAAFAFFIIALARPQTSYRQTDRTVNGVDIIMCLDISASMNIEDLGDRSRLEIAKDTMEGFIKGRRSDRIGFIIFSGEPLTLAPPTLDYTLVMHAMHEARIGDLRDGTAIGDGLSLAVGHLRNSKAKSKVIILLTDGDNNLGQVDPGTAGELALGYGIRVYTIAIGREGRVKMPIRQKGPLGNTITTYQWFDNALNPELLEQIAKQTGGRFYRVTDESALQSVFKEVDQLEKTEIKTVEKTRYEDIFQKPLKFGVALSVLEQFLNWSGWGAWGILP